MPLTVRMTWQIFRDTRTIERLAAQPTTISVTAFSSIVLHPE